MRIWRLDTCEKFVRDGRELVTNEAWRVFAAIAEDLFFTILARLRPTNG